MVSLVEQIAEEMDYRRRALEAATSLSHRLALQKAEVVAFVECINDDFFRFVQLLDSELRSRGMGEAALVICEKQPDLVDHLTSQHDWSVKHFPLLRATLQVVLQCHVEGREMWKRTHSADVLFTPDTGHIVWSDGERGFFRVHRENASGRPEFGAYEFQDLVASIGIPRRGSEMTQRGIIKDDPEIIVTRRICRDGDWPGWREPSA